MRAISAAILFLTAATCASAQTQPADTVKIVTNADMVTVTQQGGNTKVHIITNDNTGTVNVYEYAASETTTSIPANLDSDKLVMELPFTKIRTRTEAAGTTSSKPAWHKRIITVVKDIYWGWTFNYDGKAGIENSFEVGVAQLIAIEWQPWQRGPRFNVGAGFGMRRYLAGKGCIFAKEGDRLLSRPVDEDSHLDHSRWDVCTFHIPFRITQNIYKHFGISAGAIVNFNTYGKVSSRWEQDGVRYTETIKGLQQRLLTVDLIGIIGLTEWIGAYVRWSPMNVMRHYYGPEFKSWSIGAIVNF